MRLLSARLIIALIVGVTLVSLCTSYYQVLVQSRGMRHDLDRRAEVLGDSLARNVERDLERDAQRTLQRTVQQFANREHLAGLAVYDTQGKPLAVTTNLQPLMESAPPVVLEALKENRDTKAFLRMGVASIHIYAMPLHNGDTLAGSLAIVHDRYLMTAALQDELSYSLVCRIIFGNQDSCTAGLNSRDRMLPAKGGRRYSKLGFSREFR